MSGKFSDKTKAMVVARAQGRCEICGIQTKYAHFHHRNPRRMGGTSRKELGGADNALYLHPNCHERVERNRASAYLVGWLLTTNEIASQVPVRLWDGWFLLHPDGSKTNVVPDVDVPVDLDPVSRSHDAEGSGSLPDCSEDGSLADAKPDGDGV